MREFEMTVKPPLSTSQGLSRQTPRPRTILINHLLEPPDRITGISIYLFSLLAELDRLAGFKYVLATTWSAQALAENLNLKNTEIITCPYIRSHPISLLHQRRSLPKLIRDTGADLEFSPSPVSGTRGSWPRVSSVHDLYFDVQPNNYLWRHRLWWKIFFPFAMKTAAQVICVSETTRLTLEKFYPFTLGKAVAIPSASNLPSNGRLARPNGRVALLVANIAPNKGAAILVQALSILQSKGILLDLHHIGRDEYGVLTKANCALAHPVSIKHLGKVSKGELADAYRSALFLAFPSLYEGFGLPIVEAQTFGLPVIASAIPVLEEVAGRGALYFPKGDANSMADCMERLVESQSLWQELSAAAVSNVRQFSWTKTAERVQEVFENVLKIPLSH